MPVSFVIFDTEFTAWPGSAETNWQREGEYREIIQIAALKVRASENAVVVEETFNEVVKPKINPNLSDYIISLTGITQDVIDEHGIDFVSCFKQFQSFIEGPDSLPCVAWGNDKSVLIDNCHIHNCTELWQLRGFFNLRSFAEQRGLPASGSASGEIAKNLGIPIIGHPHNALHDVRSITLAIEHWIKNNYLPLSVFEQIPKT